MRTLGRCGFAQPDGAAVAQLTRPLAKLVAAVDSGQGVRAGHEGVARQGLQVIVIEDFGRPAKFGTQVLVAGGPPGGGQRRGLQAGEKPGAQLRQAVGPCQCRRWGIGAGRWVQVGRRHRP